MTNHFQITPITRRPYPGHNTICDAHARSRLGIAPFILGSVQLVDLGSSFAWPIAFLEQPAPGGSQTQQRVAKPTRGVAKPAKDGQKNDGRLTTLTAQFRHKPLQLHSCTAKHAPRFMVAALKRSEDLVNLPTKAKAMSSSSSF